MKKFILILLLITYHMHADQAVFEQYPEVPDVPPNILKAPRSGEKVGISSAILAANVGVLAVLAVLALSNSHDHSHAH